MKKKKNKNEVPRKSEALPPGHDCLCPFKEQHLSTSTTEHSRDNTTPKEQHLSTSTTEHSRDNTTCKNIFIGQRG
jgi:hypothetical protein